MSIGRALLWSTADRYAGMLLSLVLLVVLSRLLTPHEVGIIQLGWVVLMLTEALRDSGVGAYLVQKKDLDTAEVRTAFSFALLFSAVPAVGIFASAGAIAAYYGEPGLRPFLRVLAPTFLLAPFSGIPLALLRRELAFESVAFVNVGCALLNAATITALTALGFSYMSSAWSAWVWSIGYIVLALAVRPDPSPFAITARDWRPVLSFGVYSAVPMLLQRIGEFLPFLVLGRLISIEALALFDRAAKLADLPDKVGTIGVQAVALPGFASEARAGRSLKQAYLDAVEHVTAVQWPGLLLIVLLAEPIVRLLLGPQWTVVVELTRIFAVALLASFSRSLAGPVLIAAGHVRDTMFIALLVLPIIVAVFGMAALHGLVAAAGSMIVIDLVRAVIANSFVCRRLGIGWRELARRLTRSLTVSAMAMTGPLAIAALCRFELGIASAAVAALLALPGWLLGLRVTRHPLGAEIVRAVQHAQAHRRVARLLER